MIKVSDFIVNYLVLKGIKDAFILPGGGCLHLAMSLFSNDKINSISTHNEIGCTIGAEAYAKVKNDVSAVFLTTGPGATHGITGVAEAFIGATPVIIISGQVKYNQTVQFNDIEGLRQVGVQELDVPQLVKSITKYAIMVTDPNDILYHLDKAYHMATSGRPGPVWLDIPIDVQSALVDESSLKSCDFMKPQRTDVIRDDIKYVAELLKNSKRPVILAGNGVRLSGGIDILKKLSCRHNIPIVTTLQGIDIYASEDPYNMGNIGYKGRRYANITLQRADVLVCVGSRLNIAATGYNYHLFADKATTVIVDIDEAEHKKKTIKYNKFIHSDAKLFLEDLYHALSDFDSESNKEWIDDCRRVKKKYSDLQNNVEHEKPDGLDMYYIFRRITTALPSSINMVADSGSVFFLAMQNADIKNGQRLITPGLASMGYSLPASVGISFAGNRSKVAAFNGDGSFMQNIQELQTISSYKLPVKIFLINNDGYFSTKEIVKRGYDDDVTYKSLKKNLTFPNYELLAKAHGVDYLCIKDLNDFDSEDYKTAMDSDSPVLINIITSNNLIITTSMNFYKSDGTTSVRPLEDMYPYLDEDEIKSVMGENYHYR